MQRKKMDLLATPTASPEPGDASLRACVAGRSSSTR
jgi:hypothetical protein